MSMQVPIFAITIEELNILQRQFLSWCLFYYNIQQMDEPPGFHIINDDRDLDSFLQARELQIKKEKIKMAAETQKHGQYGGRSREVFK